MTVLTLQPGSSGKDTFISESAPTVNYGGSTLLQMQGAGGGGAKKAFVQFDLSSIPAGVTIISAIITLTNLDVVGSGPTITAYRITTNWYEGVYIGTVPSNTDASTWNLRNANVVNNQSYTAGPGGDIGPVIGSRLFSSFVSNGPNDIDITAEVQGIYAGTITNNGWAFQTGGSGTPWNFASSDHGTAASRPKLTITYTTSQTVSPTARFAVAGRVNPTVVKGSIASEPSTRDAVGATAGPAVLSGYTLTPIDNAGAVAGTVAPTVVIGGMTFPGGNASARGDTVNPTVAIGGMTFLGGVAGAVAGRNAPTIDKALTGVAGARGSTVGPSSTLRGGGPEIITPASARGSTNPPASLVDLTLRPSAATAIGATVGKAIALRLEPLECTPDPLLVITDGTFRPNGQRNWLSLIRNGFMLNNWQPAIAQYKSGGTFSDSVLAEGRRLVRRQFGNAIEVMDLRAKADSQDRVISFVRELFAWQEAAADYWVADWGFLPVYIIAKAAKETNPRYAIIHTISIPELTNPYGQPFYSRNGKAAFDAITLRIERGPWTSTPPGLGECVPVSAIRSWTVQGWGQGNSSGTGFTPITGSVRSLIQTKTGDILAGTNDQGWIYRSSDNGQHWVQLFKIGSGTDTVNALAMTHAGNLFAAVTGSAAAKGIWKSTNNGVSWTRVYNPVGSGYYDITYSLQRNYLTAGGGSGSMTVQEPATLISSADEGVTWFTPISTPSQYTARAVATHSEPYIPTLYPGQVSGNSITEGSAVFFGYDTYYTIAGALYPGTPVPSTYVTSTPGSGQMGNGGLDMAAFIHRNDQGTFYKKALWAVRSAADTTDTEIWQWPNPAGGFNFGKLATIDNKIFNVLYVDPVPTPPAGTGMVIPTQRTIWAGANGEILVSYNNGLTWTVATTAPVNQVRSLLRTTAGTLIAGGDSGEIFIYTGSSGSQGGNTNTAPPPTTGGTIVNTYALGMEETCEDALVVTNKSTFTNITHIFHFNGSTFSELQFATVPPYELLGSTAVVNKAVYFGSKTSDANVPGGTFTNLVFEITRIAENITLVWEFWNGSSWVALTVQDSSAGFRTMGPGSIHWVMPMTWATTTVNGVLGYWVRARISAVATNPVTPVHDNIHSHRYIYTANLPYAEIADNAVGGDLPAAAQIRWHNRSDDPLLVLDLEVDRVICGLRSVSRGNYFNAYLNISDQQIPFGLSISKDADGIWGPMLRAPTGRGLTISYSSAGRLNAWNDLVTFSLSNTVARDYYGSYRVFGRVYKYGTGTNNWQLRVRNSFGTGGSESLTKAVFPTTAGDWEVIDFGQLTIPTSQVSFLRNNLGDSLTLTVQGFCTATGIGIVLYDLILIPTDEWAIDSRSPNPTISDVAKIKGDGFLDIDSITNPKVMVTATNRNAADQIVSNYQMVTNGAAMLQARNQQRLWFLVMSYENFWRAYPEIAGSVQAYKQQKYLAFRGAA